MSLDPSVNKTGATVPSDQALDLQDNTLVFDTMVNDNSGQTVLDRKGVERETYQSTINRINKDANDVIDSYRAKYIGDYKLPNKTFQNKGDFVVWAAVDGGDDNAYVYVGPESGLPYQTDVATYPIPGNDPNLQVNPTVTALYVQQQDLNRQKETTGLSNITDAEVGLDIFPLIGQGLRVAGVGLWTVPSITADGSPMPNPANLDAVPTDNAVTINGGTDVILVTAISNNTITLSQCGANPGVDSSDAINFAFELGVIVEIDDDYIFTSITIPKDARVKGLGSLIGMTGNGVKPTYEQMRDAPTPGDRLTLLQAYNNNTVNFTGSGQLRGSLTISNALVTGGIVLVRGLLELIDSSSYETGIEAVVEGTVLFDDGVITDSPSRGAFTDRVGTYHCNNAIITHCGGRGLQSIQGNIFANDAKISDTVSDGINVTGGGNVFAKRAIIENAGESGALAIYSSNIELDNAQIINPAEAGMVCESNSSIFGELASIDGAGGRGATTSYNGFILLRSGSIKNCGSYAVDTLTGGQINIDKATVDNTNTGVGGVIIRAKDSSMIFSEPAGGTGKTTLVASNFNPAHGVISNGLALITDSQNDFTQYPNNDTGISHNTEVMPRQSETISGGSINGDANWKIIDTEGGAATDNLDNINQDSYVSNEVIILQIADNSRTVTVRHNQGNIRTADGSDIVLDATARLLKLYWLRQQSLWVQAF